MATTMEDNRLIEPEEDREDFRDEQEEEEEEEEEDEDEDEDYEEDEEDYEEEVADELIPVNMTSLSTSCEGRPVNQENGGGDEGKEELKRGEIDGVFCPICFEAWTSGGEHQVCCLPCGHIFGLSCIKKWLQRGRSSRKCPQCKGLCTSKDVRVLYPTRLCFADEELQKTVRFLETKCAYLEKTVQTHPLRRQDAADSDRVLQLLEELTVGQHKLIEALEQQLEGDEVLQKRMEEVDNQLLDEFRIRDQEYMKHQAFLKHKMEDMSLGIRAYTYMSEYYRCRDWQHWENFRHQCALANLPPLNPFPTATSMYYPYGPDGEGSSSQMPPQPPPQPIPLEYDAWYRSLHIPRP